MPWSVEDRGLCAFTSSSRQSLSVFPSSSSFSMRMWTPASAGGTRRSFVCRAIAGEAVEREDGQVAFQVFLEDWLVWIYVWVPEEFVSRRVVWRLQLRWWFCQHSLPGPQDIFPGAWLYTLSYPVADRSVSYFVRQISSPQQCLATLGGGQEVGGRRAYLGDFCRAPGAYCRALYVASLIVHLYYSRLDCLHHYSPPSHFRLFYLVRVDVDRFAECTV